MGRLRNDASPQPVIARMDGAFLSATSALGGSLVGGLISGIATWASQRVQARTVQLAREISLRETLYSDFIAAASKAYGDAIVNDRPQIEELAALQAMITRMRIVSSPRIVACAEQVHLNTTGTYFMPNKTIRELYEAMKGGRPIDPLKDFSDAVREEARQRYPGVPWLLSIQRPLDLARADHGTATRRLPSVFLNSLRRRRAD
jgi:hypothetical protein